MVEFIISGIRICKASAPTALPMDHAADIINGAHLEYSQTPRDDTSNQGELQEVPNHSTSQSPMRDLYNHIMDETISPSSNVDPSTASDIRTRPTSNNSGHC